MNFIHIGFLTAGAVAMTLPIWIHLLLRQRARSVDIGSIRFVKQVVRRTRNRQRIQRFILLALRALAVLLLGLLFARPFLPDTPADGRTREVAVLIDRSASMSAEFDDGQTAFRRAIERAKELVGDLGEKTKVQIGLFDSAGVESIKLEDLATAETTSLATRYDDAFAWATDVLSQSSRADRELLFLSDLQRVGMATTNLAGFPPDIPVRIENTSPSIAQNLAIESAGATQIEIRPGVPITMALQIVNHGAIPLKELPIQIRLDGPAGVVTKRLSRNLTAGMRDSMSIALPIDQPGAYFGEVTVDYKDAYPWDNRFALAFEVRHPDRILLIDGDAGNRPWENETYFVETGLRLQTAVGDGPARTFEVERLVWDRGSGFPNLDGYRLIIAANLARFTSGDAGRLMEFVVDGGNVLWFPGERSNNMVHKNLVSAGLLGDAVLGRGIDTLARIDSFDKKHPAFEMFSAPQHGDLRSLVANRIIPLDSVDPDSKVIASNRRFPIIVSHSSYQNESRLGGQSERLAAQGQFVFVATSADRSWSQWPQNRLFVPLLRQLASWLTGQLDERGTIRTEFIRQPNQRPGVHRLGAEIVARNVDSSESQIGKFSPEQFQETTGLPEKAVVTVESDRREELTPDGASRSDEKWPWIIWTLLGILGCEFFLASRVHE